jgi:hypothetical protein
VSVNTDPVVLDVDAISLLLLLEQINDDALAVDDEELAA